ncbi:MAG: hypothetical protein AAFY56_05150, partial [Pseudomonadota bacterium]
IAACVIGSICAAAVAQAEEGVSLGPESKLTYVPSLSVPLKLASHYGLSDAATVFDRLLSVLDDSPLDIVSVDRDRGLIATQYETDPEPFLDCGHYVRVFAAGDSHFRVQPIPAARARILLEDESRNEQVERRIALFGRTLFSFDYESEPSDLTFSTLYAVSLSLQSMAAGAVPVHEEVISFDADAEGRFDNGIVCHASGRMENLLAALIDETLVDTP